MNVPNRLSDIQDRWIKQPNGCWDWVGSLNGNGYGQFMYRGKYEMAHRVSWMFYKGEVPEGKWILHTCDNRKCLNPEHLFVGTRQDNINDMHNKNRAALQTGSSNHNVKLNDKKVLKIRNDLIKGKTCAELAKEYNVSWNTIKLIQQRKTWNHI